MVEVESTSELVCEGVLQCIVVPC